MKNGSAIVKAAFSSWNNRIAPVFDVARQFLLVENENGRIMHKTEEIMPAGDPGDQISKARYLEGLGVSNLVCGAISRTTQDLVQTCRIVVVPFISGDLSEVVRAWVEGRIHEEAFAMPGCCPQGKRNRPGSSGVGAGRGRCAAGGAPGAGSGGICICPQCFHQEPHEAGIPCSRKLCPVCGCAMARG